MYSYCDYAGDKEDRKSTFGYCTYVGGNFVTWNKKQNVVSHSSVEVEYRGMAHSLWDNIVKNSSVRTWFSRNWFNAHALWQIR